MGILCHKGDKPHDRLSDAIADLGDVAEYLEDYIDEVDHDLGDLETEYYDCDCDCDDDDDYCFCDDCDEEDCTDCILCDEDDEEEETEDEE